MEVTLTALRNVETENTRAQATPARHVHQARSTLTTITRRAIASLVRKIHIKKEPTVFPAGMWVREGLVYMETPQERVRATKRNATSPAQKLAVISIGMGQAIP